MTVPCIFIGHDGEDLVSVERLKELLLQKFRNLQEKDEIKTTDQEFLYQRILSSRQRVSYLFLVGKVRVENVIAILKRLKIKKGFRPPKTFIITEDESGYPLPYDTEDIVVTKEENLKL